MPPLCFFRPSASINPAGVRTSTYARIPDSGSLCGLSVNPNYEGLHECGAPLGEVNTEALKVAEQSAFNAATA